MTTTPTPRPSRRHLLRMVAATGVSAAVAPAQAASQTRTATDAARDPGKLPCPLPRVEVAPGGHLLQTEDGRPFFWLGDTAWELIHHTTRAETSYYLRARARQGFTVIQTVVLSEFDGVTEPSALGLKPFLDNTYTRLNPAYLDRVAEIVDEAATSGLYVALLPAWGDKLTAPWGAGPRLFRHDNLSDAHHFAQILAARLRDRSNVLWVLGGDRPARVGGLQNSYLSEVATKAGFAPDVDWRPIWRAFAAGLADGLGRRPLIAYHPQGGEQSSSVQIGDEPWLSINGMQSGHGSGHDVPVWEWVARDYALSPARPTLDLEPNYEDHPVNPWPTWDPALGYFRDHDVRRQVYRSVFAGACGVTYGHHAVWGFINARNQPINHSDMDWVTAIDRPAARQMRSLRDLLESRPFFGRVPDNTLIRGGHEPNSLRALAMRDRDGHYAMVYLPQSDQTLSLDLRRLGVPRLNAWWYDPRAGMATPAADVMTGAAVELRSPAYGPDWVLVLDDPRAGFAPPGLQPQKAVCSS